MINKIMLATRTGRKLEFTEKTFVDFYLGFITTDRD